MAKTPTWQRAAGKNPEGGLNEAGRRSLRAAGHDIKRPQPEGGPRKKSFCARMKGMKAQNTSAETANDPNSRINKSLRKWKCADGGEITVDNALRMAQGRPDEGGQERFLREQLAGSAPQYEPSQDFPARAERAVQAADRYAGVLNDLAARGAGLPKEFQSPQGRSAREIVESALPQDPNAVVKQAMRQAGEGNRLAAAETMLGGIPETGAIRAYHGSPHRFDRFDISKIGTGEGAQAYGHGLYFAENPKVAEEYRQALAGVKLKSGETINPDWDDPRYLGLQELRKANFDSNKAREEVIRKSKNWPEQISAFEELVKQGVTPEAGHMYEVEIAAEPHQLLDWDRPLSEQSPQVRNIIRKSDFYKKALDEYKNQKQWYLDPRQKTGESYLKYMRAGVPSEELGVLNPEGSLLEAGIPGIQYLDAGSRGAGEGSRNFVIFDPSLIDIKRRYAEGGDVTVDNALRMARNTGGGTLYNQLNYALNSPTPANPPQDPGPQQPYYQSLPQTRDIIQQYGTPAPGAPTSSAVRQPMPYAKGGKAIWNKPRPKNLGKSEPLSPAQKASAKAAAKAAGRPYPNMVDNLRAARKADGGQVEGDVQFAPNDLPMMARQPDVEIENALRMARETQPKKEYAPFGVLPLREDEAGIHFDPYAGVLGSVTRPFKYFTETMSGQKPMDVTSPEAISAAADIAGATTLGAGAFERPAGALAAGASRPAKQAMREAYQRALNPTGLYSHAAEAAYNLPQAKGSYEQMIAMLQKAGVKPEEMRWSGVEQFAGQPVTREQLVSHFEQNVPKIEETVLGSYQNPYSHRTADEWQAAINRAERAGNFDEAERLTNAWEHFEGYGASGASGSAKFQQYTIPGGENYREVLLHTPSQKQDLYKQISRAREDRIAAVKEHGSVLKYDDPALEQERLQKIREATKRENDLRAKLENIAPEYTSSHWDQPNVLGHLRMSDRTGPEGEKILHLEELQSDWGQQGRERGFGSKKLSPDEEAEYYKLHGMMGSDRNEAQQARLDELIDRMNKASRAVPSAPYVEKTQNWTDLGLKRALKEAAEGGYSKMVWTPGEEQAARYDLSKHIDELHWHRGNLVAYDKDGNKVIQRTGMSASELPDVVGKDVADKLLAQEAGSDGWRSLEGQDLKVGGEGMKGFYDKIVPTRLKELLKKIDPQAKIETDYIKTGDEWPFSARIASDGESYWLAGNSPYAEGEQRLSQKFSSYADADKQRERLYAGYHKPVHSITITPKMREAILKGLPAYAHGGEVVNKDDPYDNIRSKAKNFPRARRASN